MAKKKLVEPENLNESNVLEFAKVIGEYRSQNIDTQLQKQWIVEAANKLQFKESEVILDIPDNWYIDTWGYVSRLYNIGLLKDLSNINKLNLAIQNMIDKVKMIEKETKPKQSPMELVKEQVAEFYNTIFPVLNNPDFDIVNATMTMQLSNTHIRQLINIMDDCIHKDKLVDYLDNAKDKDKKTRKKKTVSKEDKCKLFTCLDKYDGIDGYKGEDVIGASCVAVYHTQKKTITFYHGKKLNVHRSMIIDFDKDLSGEYKLKDKDHLNIKGKVRMMGIYNSFYQTEVKNEPTGRVSDKMIIIGVC